MPEIYPENAITSPRTASVAIMRPHASVASSFDKTTFQLQIVLWAERSENALVQDDLQDRIG